jgi:hypothetical protein
LLESSSLRPIPKYDLKKTGLANLLRKASWALQLKTSILASGVTLLSHACKLDFEGIVSKRLSVARANPLSALQTCWCTVGSPSPFEMASRDYFCVAVSNSIDWRPDQLLNQFRTEKPPNVL